jgi:hypothetical protein
LLEEHNLATWIDVTPRLETRSNQVACREPGIGVVFESLDELAAYELRRLLEFGLQTFLISTHQARLAEETYI